MLRPIATAAAAFATAGAAALPANHDASLAAAADATQRARGALLAAAAPRRAGLPSIVDPALGRATFLWAADGSPPATVGALQPAALAIARARELAGRQASALGLGAAAVEQAEARLIHATRGGASIVRLQQRVDGVEVFNRQINVMLGSRGEPIASAGYFAPQTASASPRRLDAAQAVAAAVADAGGSLPASALRAAGAAGRWMAFQRARPAR